MTNGEVTNLAAMVQGPLSGAMDADQILAWTRLFVGILEWAGHGGDALPDADRFYRDLSLPDDDREKLGLRRD